MSNSKVLDAVKRLDAWIDQNGWAGYDPYDIKGIPWVIKLTYRGYRSRYLEMMREAVFELFYMFPKTARRILHVNQTFNAKGIGLLARSYLDLFLILKDERYLQKAQAALRWLEENVSTGYHGVCWGYPFDWRSLQFIPKGTPSGVVTSTVGDAFWAYYRYSGDNRYLDICRSICEFFLNDLNIDPIDNERICFSYTPVTNDHVHNANLFVGEFLMRVGIESQIRSYIEYGRKALNYTLSYQNNDGSFNYKGPPDVVRGWIDHYHTGFVLRCLYSVYKHTKEAHLYKNLERGYYHYIENLFEDKTIPKLLPNRKYRLDIHSCSEAILCLSELSEDFPEGAEIVKNVARWTIDNMQDEDGHFYYAKVKSRFTGVVFTSKIPYMRWGQAWMMRALAELALRMECV